MKRVKSAGWEHEGFYREPVVGVRVCLCVFCGVGAVFNTRVGVWKRRRGLCIIHDATRGGTQSDIMSQG